jgi:hypothetical protein
MNPELDDLVRSTLRRRAAEATDPAAVLAAVRASTGRPRAWPRPRLLTATAAGLALVAVAAATTVRLDRPDPAPVTAGPAVTLSAAPSPTPRQPAGNRPAVRQSRIASAWSLDGGRLRVAPAGDLAARQDSRLALTALRSGPPHLVYDRPGADPVLGDVDELTVGFGLVSISSGPIRLTGVPAWVVAYRDRRPAAVRCPRMDGTRLPPGAVSGDDWLVYVLTDDGHRAVRYDERRALCQHLFGGQAVAAEVPAGLPVRGRP